MANMFNFISMQNILKNIAFYQKENQLKANTTKEGCNQPDYKTVLIHPSVFFGKN